MKAGIGTIELFARTIGEALQAMGSYFDPDKIEGLFADLGLQLPDGFIESPAIVSVIGNAKTISNGLGTQLLELTNGLSSGASIDIIKAGVDLISKISPVINSLNSLGDQIKTTGLSFPGLTPAQQNQLQSFSANFSSKFIQLLIIKWFDANYPLFSKVAGLIGIRDFVLVPADPDNLVAPHIPYNINFNHIGLLFSNPGDYFKNVFGFGNSSFDGLTLMSGIKTYLDKPSLLADLDETTGNVQLTTPWFNLSVDKTVNPPELLVYIAMPPDWHIYGNGPLTDTWSLQIDSKGTFPEGTGIKISSDGTVTLIPSSGTAGLSFSFGLQAANANGLSIIGIPGGSGIAAQQATITTGLNISTGSATPSGPFTISLGLKNGSLIIDPSLGDGFIQTLTGGNQLKSDFSIDSVWDFKNGLSFSGNPGVDITIPLHVDLGPVLFTSLYIGGSFQNDGSMGLEISGGMTGNLGPLTVMVDRMGINLEISFPSNGTGNLGPVDIGINFKPPNGVGLTVDAGIITGGGYLYINTAKGQYFGALELEFEDLFSLKAVGIIDTKMPDGSKGFSLLIIITADFVPLQLGFGFTLNGVGGLLGLNRTMNVDELKEGIKTNAIKSVLFPQDIIANIDKIVSDLEQIFPIYEGHFIVGPMGELGWGAIITLEIGFLIEIPDATIAIPGVLMALIPSEDAPLLRIQVNFVGIIDFDNKIISFDASLYDSNLLVFTLTGDMAFRLSWGDNPYFILSVGGFNPAFTDAPPDLQHMARLGISLLNNDFIQLSVTCYFAVTSNSVQFGANAQLYAGVGALNIYGQLGFDVLFQFDPFKFAAGINVTLQLRSGDSVIMGISVNGQLSGPAPWYVHGDASYTYIITVSVSFSHGWGDAGPDQSQNKIDILALLNTAIADNSNWRVIIPDNNSQHVSIKAVDPGTTDPVVHPFGTLTFSERIVPLGIDITRFGNDLPKDANHFDILASDPGITTIPATDKFAAANFFDLTDDQKLSRHSFDLMTSGFSVTNASDLLTSAAISEDVDYKLSYLGQQPNILRYVGKYRYPKNNFASNLKSSAVSRSPLSYARNRVSSNAPDPVSVVATKYAVANMSDMKLVDGSMVADSYSTAKAQYDNLLKSQPGLKGQVQIVFDHELSTN